MSDTFGWTGRVLCIDLSAGKHRTITPSEEIYRKFIGGKGLAGYFLRPLCGKTWDSPEMPLLIFNGPLVNTASPTSGRFTVMSISPLTGTVGDSSAGGKFGTELKKAGWDGIIITGKSSGLCAIEIDNSECRIISCPGLAGRGTEQTLSVMEDGGKAAVGPAAENGVKFAGICFDGHSFAGRNGLGLVMATKNLKYIHVKGQGKTPVFDEVDLKKAREDVFRLVSASPVLKGELGISEYGTGALFDLIHSRRMMPTDNFRATRFEGAEKLNAHSYKNKFSTSKTGCTGCHIQCKKKSYDGRAIPEFETMSHFTALIGNRDIDIVIEANKICNDAGMDTISAASTIACWMEIENLKFKDIDLLQILKDISLSRNEGAALKYGSAEYARNAGRPGTSMSVKGLELPAYDPRGALGMGLAYATSTRGGCHLRAYPVSHEILRKPVATDRFSFTGKARIIKIAEDMNALIDSLTACKFIFFGTTIEEYAHVFNAVTGMDTNGSDLLRAGERIYYNERMMNCIRGFSSDDDDLPERFFTDQGSSGEGIEILPLNRDDFLETRGKYYRIRGVTPQGKPEKNTCLELGLEWTDC